MFSPLYKISEHLDLKVLHSCHQLGCKKINASARTGYLDPDYVTGNPITTKSDVYSFGVVLLQLASGRPAIDLRSETSESRSLVDWVSIF